MAEAYGIELPESEGYDTLAGWILHSTGGLPAQGQEITIGAFRVTIAQVHHGRIDLVRLKLPAPPRR